MLTLGFNLVVSITLSTYPKIGITTPPLTRQENTTLMPKPLILVTNDDGIRAPGLKLLANALSTIADVRVYAPDRERSAVSHGVSLHHPLRVTRLKENWYMVDGTPVDCVMLAVRELLGRKPDLVVSGVNPGANLGDDVTYSGTMAGAREGMLLGVPAIAMSDVSHRPKHMDTAAQVAVKLAQYVLAHGLQKDTALNVNVPDVPFDALQGAAITRMGQRDYMDEILERKDPRGRKYYWIGGSAPTHICEAGTDFEAIEADKVSITPIGRDTTQHNALETLNDLPLTF